MPSRNTVEGRDAFKWSRLSKLRVSRSESHRFEAVPQRPCSQCQGLSYLLARRRVKRSSDRSRYRAQRRRVLSNRRDRSAPGDKRLSDDARSHQEGDREAKVRLLVSNVRSKKYNSSLLSFFLL